MIIPVLAHVYWHGEMPSPIETGMRAATLIGTVIGQLGFGVLADMYGRRKMYGFELLIVAIATVGVAMAANGASGSMSLVGWLVSWRFIMGVGIGGDYPLSAVITSEFAPTRSRARMIATVFYMQPCGYLVATVIAIFALLGHKNGIPQNIPTRIEDIRSCTDDEACRRAVDSVWRWVIGIGAIPAVIAMFFRFTIPESPRYTLEVLNRPEEALQDINAMTGSTLYPSRSDVDVEMQPADAANGNPLIPRPSTARESRPEMAEVGNANPPGDAASEISTPGAANDPRAMSTRSSVTTVELQNRGQDDDGEDEDAYAHLVQPTRWQKFATGFYEHFITNGHWPTLAGTASAWACFVLILHFTHSVPTRTKW
jgi:PHS family inorganic phosphate transporter-like MFS transporter